MLKNIRTLSLIVLAVFAAGCASKGIHVHSYIDDRERVDQGENGNSGYLMGAAPDQGEVKPTRKVFVVEVSKEANETADKTRVVIVPDENESDSITAASGTSTVKSSTQTNFQTSSTPKIQVPSFPESSGKTVEYKVEKDDTLQKIAKKFYGSYGKWTKIYQLNKEKIKNPDRIQPGITLTIPLE